MTDAEKFQTVRITNIQRFCLHDGPGIRTTVFLKGCSLHCPWCANPENIHYEVQIWQDPVTGETGAYGYEITLEALYKELIHDRDYFLEGGGITFSGGEPLLQIDRYEPLLKKLKEEKIHLAVETALFVKHSCVETALKYFDWWYVDMKILLSNQCERILGGRVEQYRENLSLVAHNTPNLHIRIPCCHGFTDTPENICCILETLQIIGIEGVELLEVHHLGEKKRVSLGWPDGCFSRENRQAVTSIAQVLRNAGMPCKEMTL